MTTTPKALIDAKFAEAAETPQYESKDCKTSIDKFTATNVTAANATIAVRLPKSGETAGTGNTIVHTKTIAAGACYAFPELIGHILESGDVLSTLAGTANAIVLRASGRQFT